MIINDVDFDHVFAIASAVLHANVDVDIHRRTHWPARSKGQRERFARERETHAGRYSRKEDHVGSA